MCVYFRNYGFFFFFIFVLFLLMHTKPPLCRLIKIEKKKILTCEFGNNSSSTFSSVCVTARKGVLYSDESLYLKKKKKKTENFFFLLI